MHAHSFRSRFPPQSPKHFDAHTFLDAANVRRRTVRFRRDCSLLSIVLHD